MVTRTRNAATERNKTPATKTAAAAAGTSKRASRTGADTAPLEGVGATPTERDRLIAEAAYYIAEGRGFSPGNELNDWLEAEREVDIRIRSSMH